MMDMDPDFYKDDLFDPSDIFDDWEEWFGASSDDDCEHDCLDEIRNEDSQYFYDTYDRVIDNVDFEESEDSVLGNPNLMGMAFALADEIADSKETTSYDMDEGTDAENWQQAMKQNYPTSGRKDSRFDQIVNDICKGRRPWNKIDDL